VELAFIFGLILLALSRSGRRAVTEIERSFSRALYPPGAPETVALFREAARRADLPDTWPEDPGLHNILHHESGGRVGVPNSTFGGQRRLTEIWAALKSGTWRPGWAGEQNTSSATGLGQLIVANVRRHYPSGVAGIGDALEEAIGMLRYIAERYGTPEAAWAKWQTQRWY
jgi:hypothetical protein